MQHIKDENYECIEVDELNLVGQTIAITNASNFENCDIAITAGPMTWSQLDKLKEVIKEAERRWRGKMTVLPPFHHS